MGVGWCKEMQGDDPLHLAFQARRGMGWVGRRQAPSVSLFERGRGMGGLVEEDRPPPSFLSDGGG